MELFLENGFSKTTAAAICKKANIGTGNLTCHFPTKEHILNELVTVYSGNFANFQFPRHSISI